MEPNILCILDQIHKMIKGDTDTITFFKNNTYLLLEKNDTIESIIEKTDLDLIKINETVHVNFMFFKSHVICLVMHQSYPQVGNLILLKKSDIKPNDEHMPEIKEQALLNIKKDFLDRDILIDSKTDNLNNYALTMYLIINSDLKMGKGKIAAQIGHAVEELIEGLVKNPTQNYIDWKNGTRKKIVVKASEIEIENLLKCIGLEESSDKNKEIQEEYFIAIKDAGCTQVKPGSVTVIGFKPMLNKDVPIQLKTFKLL